MAPDSFAGSRHRSHLSLNAPIQSVALTGCAHLGDAGLGQPPEHSGVRETEAAGSGTAAVSGEPVAPGRAGGHPAAAAAQRAGGSPAGGGKEAPGVPGAAATVRRGWAHCGKHAQARLAAGQTAGGRTDVGAIALSAVGASSATQPAPT